MEELTELTKVTERTIQTDIDRINKTFPLISIESDSKSLIELKCSNNVGLESVYRKVMFISVEFTFLEYLLTNPKQTINFYVEELSISESLLRQIINKWNKMFERRAMDVSISTFPSITIEGDERTIRQLFKQYMIEKYGGNFPRKFGEESSIKELITYAEKVLSIEVPFSSRMRLFYWLFVNIQRIKHRNFIDPKDYTQSGKILAQSLYANVNKDILFMERFRHRHQIRLSFDIVLDLVDIHDYEITILDYVSTEEVDHGQKESNFFIKGLKDFLLSFYNSVGYESLVLEQTLATISNSFRFQHNIPFFFYNYHGEFKEHVSATRFLISA